MSKNMDADRAKGHTVELGFIEKVASRLPEDLEILQALADLANAVAVAELRHQRPYEQQPDQHA